MKKDTFILKIAKEQNINDNQVQAVVSLLAEGATIPFIARYRKEATGSLDEVAVMAIRDRLNQLRELKERKGTILKSLEKLDPKSIGVGQYQHDVDQRARPLNNLRVF